MYLRLCLKENKNQNKKNFIQEETKEKNKVFVGVLKILFNKLITHHLRQDVPLKMLKKLKLRNYPIKEKIYRCWCHDLI